jgi:hypothetical protein
MKSLVAIEVNGWFGKQAVAMESQWFLSSEDTLKLKDKSEECENGWFGKQAVTI